MIISRTPFRISFFGGGTDYPVWFRTRGGAALATAIDKYCYITSRYLPPFFDHKYRIAYSQIERVNELDQIRHPAIRECLRYMKVADGVEIHHDADLPGRSGLGSSSAFSVGLLNALHALLGRLATPMALARAAICVEQEINRENVGCQDQVTAAFGGFNVLRFLPDGSILVDPLTIREERRRELNDHLMLCYTGLSRTASDIAAHQIRGTSEHESELHRMREMVDESVEILQGKDDIVAFGRLLHEGWTLKKRLSDRISNGMVDAAYDAARNAGADGGKIIGAGGGGFLLLFVRPERQAAVRSALGDMLFVPFHFEREGSRIIFYQPDESTYVGHEEPASLLTA